MPDLFLELLTEEIPARMQVRGAEDLARLVTDALVARGLLYEGARAFAGPRRLALHVAGLPARQPERREERKGPRVGAPAAAIQGFLKSAGLADIGEARIVSDPKKGDSYLAVIARPGQATLDVLAEVIPEAIRGFPWPKSMRWGARSASPDALRWVRPLRGIVATFGPETEEPEVVPFEVGGIASGDVTYGHRVMAPGPIRVRRLEDWEASLERAKVVPDHARRMDLIRHEAAQLAFAAGLELVEDEALLAEVAGLVEWPVVMMGSFDPAFLAVPEAAIRATIRANQKCFVLRDGAGRLAPRFVLVANLEATDGGAAIVAGNERVVRARLSDARFFYENDLAVPLEQRLEKLRGVTFHEKLGTQAERVERIAALARELAPLVGADPAKAERAARLAKADLVTEMVGEFPELQGLMGRLYAEAQGEDAEVSRAVEEHYKPVGPSDAVPSAPVSVAVALADKLDTLVGFFAIDEKPTGSKDPYALRRAALGVIRLMLENKLHVDLGIRLLSQNARVFATLRQGELSEIMGSVRDLRETSLDTSLIEKISDLAFTDFKITNIRDFAERTTDSRLKSYYEILDFLADRLKIQLRDQGARHDLVDAVFALGGQDDLVLIVRRVDALGRLLATEDGANLLAGYRRAANILRIEERRDGEGAFAGEPDPALYALLEEHALAGAVAAVAAEARAAVEREDFDAAVRALARLRAPVDAFFERVTVNAPEPDLRANRLRLLNALRAATLTVADFVRIEG